MDDKMSKRESFSYLLMVAMCCIITIGIYHMNKQTIPKIQRRLPTVTDDLRGHATIKVTGPKGTHIPEYFRQQPKSRIFEVFCRNIGKPTVSNTVPTVYPDDGIGINANLSSSVYDTSHFREFCDSNMNAIVQVYSAAQNFARRKAIRDTIGQQCVTAGCKVMFILAISRNESVNQQVMKEYAEKGDMFMKDKIDAYNDLNNKAVAMLDWLIEYCQQPRFVLQLIDDAFINVINFLHEMNSIQHTNRYFYGKVFKNQKPHRNTNSIYYVSKEIYPNANYPDFVVGISSAFPNSLTRELRCAVHRAAYVWMADVWLMGLIKEYLDLPLIQTTYMTPDKEQLNLKDIESCLYIHHTGPEDFYRFQQALDTKKGLA